MSRPLFAASLALSLLAAPLAVAHELSQEEERPLRW